MARSDRSPGWFTLLAWLAVTLAVIAWLLVLLPGPAYRLQLLELGSALSAFRLAMQTGLSAAFLAVVAGLGALLARRPRAAVPAVAALLLGATAMLPPLQLARMAASVPAIHDITTDTDDPPGFVALAEARRAAPNAVEYPGEKVARQQRQAYPDLAPVRYDASAEQVYREAVAAAEALGWHIEQVAPEEGRVEAVDTTFWFGFRDDVVIRVRQEDDYVRVDVRSASRVGRSDLGTNARRIRAYLDELEARL